MKIEVCPLKIQLSNNYLNCLRETSREILTSNLFKSAVLYVYLKRESTIIYIYIYIYTYIWQVQILAIYHII